MKAVLSAASTVVFLFFCASSFNLLPISAKNLSLDYDYKVHDASAE